MGLVAAVGAKEESAAVVQPGEGPFDDPALTSEGGAVFGLASRDHRLDSALPDEATVLVVVVAAVGDEAVGTPPRPTRPRTGGTLSSSASNWVMSLRLPPVSDQASGSPLPSTRPDGQLLSLPRKRLRVDERSSHERDKARVPREKGEDQPVAASELVGRVQEKVSRG